MKIVSHERFYDSTYADDCAAVPGRLESIMTVLEAEPGYAIVRPPPATEDAVLLAHTQAYVDTIKANGPLYDMALLAAGAATEAANIGVAGEPAFACLRPPGHHAYRASAWGYCVFCNMGVALLQLRQQRRIESACILDFDAHTGDGTKDVLADWKECHILNPFAGDGEGYLKEIQEFLSGIPAVDIVGVCAGFDAYTKDVGRKLTTFDFYRIGFLMKQFASRAAHQRRFAVLEGGYYLPDLGKNVLAFCQGFE